MVCKINKVQKGGKILGKGRDGLVVTPPIMCNARMNEINKISKLINITDVSKRQYNDYVAEYKAGKKFRKVDPNFFHFLPGIDMCEISENGVSDEIRQDIVDGGYKQPGVETFMLNIVMKKGEDYDNITKSLTATNFLKSLVYLLHGAQKCVYELKTLLLDIKSPNLLYSQDDDDSEDIYPVFIDFSADFVISNKKGFQNFIEVFGGGMPYYDTWPFEIFALFYEQYLYERNSESADRYKQFIKNLKTYRNIDIKSVNGERMVDKVLQYVNNKMRTSAGSLALYDKIMMYAIGKVYYRAFSSSSFKNDKFIDNILRNLMNEDITYRWYAQDAIVEIRKKIKYRGRSGIKISLKSGKKDKMIKKKVQKALKVKKNNPLLNWIKNQQKNKFMSLQSLGKVKKTKKWILKKPNTPIKVNSATGLISPIKVNSATGLIPLDKLSPNINKLLKKHLKPEELAVIFGKMRLSPKKKKVVTKKKKVVTKKKKVVTKSSKCKEWKNNPLVNPTTGRKIKLNGPTYKKLAKECGSPDIK